MPSGICGWHKTVRVEDGHAHFHITKADYSIERGYITWIFPPRIGIDFRKKKKFRGKHYIPNIDIGELVRFIKILRLLHSKKFFKSGKVQKFIVEQTPDRRIRFWIEEGTVVLEYRHTGWKTYAPMARFKPKRIPRLIKALQEALGQYVTLIKRWNRTGKLPEQFKRKLARKNF